MPDKTNETYIPPAPALSAIVLAGGRSRRMGQDKRRLKLWGEAGPTLLEHTVQLVGQLCDDVIVVLNDAQDWPQLAARCVPDAYPQGGALGGIYSGLAATRSRNALLVACDMPFLNPALLAFLLHYPAEYDALIPRTTMPEATRNRSGVEPLHGVYSMACLPALQACLHAGQLQITSFLDTVNTIIVEASEYQHLDPEGRSFINLNDAAQLQGFMAFKKEH